MLTRRMFIGSLAAAPAVALAAPRLNAEAFPGLLKFLNAAPALPLAEAARDESLWFQVQQAFTVDRSIVNLNNGGVSPSPAVVQDAMKRHLDFSNQAPAHNMWRVLEPQRESVRERLAGVFGCDREEIAFTRNSSESLQTCQFGFDLHAGDEVLTTDLDYPRMLTTFEQRARREGIVLKKIELPVPMEDAAAVVRLFEAGITDKTRMILMCHVINLNGQILPVREVVNMARARGVPVIVDGAHSFAQLAFTHADLDCDYFGTSLHKWTFAPHGTGMLYVRKEKIAGLWPLMAAAETQRGDIRKFEEIGTHPAANTLAIAEALAFHTGLGAARKEARLRYLREYWEKRLRGKDRVKFHNSADPRYSCAIACIELEGIDPTKLCDHLWEKRRILATPIVHARFKGVRVTPSVYTTLDELDRLVDALEGVLKNGLPA